MSTKGQTINDRLNAAKYTLAGQALARCICKATTEELMRPKKKHLDYLAACTYQPNVSMQQLTTLLIERTAHSNWAVVYKALITVHHLMSHGSEKFTQYLASSNYSFQLNNFLDRIVAKGYAMSTFIRRYSNYINRKALSYRTLALDLCRTKRKPESSVLRTMPIERLLETLPIVQKQLDALLEFGCTAEELNNSIITASFTLLFHDAIRLFASYNDGIINLFEKYFDLNKKMCREAFEAYKKFLDCTDRVAEFLKVAEAINLNNGDLPDFKRAPSSLLDAFEQHLISLESNKKRDTKVEVDTKLAAFPSFSVSNDFDPPSSAQDSPNMDDISRDLESQLGFATGDDDFIAKIATEKGPTTSSPEAVVTAFEPVKKNDSTDISSVLKSDFGDLQSISSGMQQMQSSSNNFATNGSPFDDEPFVNTTPRANLFDMNPPGFSNGSVLTPEALQISIDPSIDPRTQQQLIQIRREQVANKQHNSGVSSNNNISGTNSSHSTKSNKPSKESMFEDLEKTMRQSLMKTENA
uniref:Phosphatidylinositol-binding clathrin assembly protein LAP n=1 Tax=Aceria tosichella TaxID=561515 RepID=A0A6G1SKI9_9ACAR